MTRPRMIGISTLACLSVAAAAAAQANLFGAPGSCDKACLTGIADAYFAALVAHDPSKAAMAPNAKFTENAQVVAVGDGLWKTASEAPTNFKVYVPDPVAGQLGAIVLMKDAGKPIQLALRLKRAGGPAAGQAAGQGAPAAAPRAGGPGFGPSTCAAQINTRTFYYITSIDLRRVWIADEEKGLVFGLSMFRHPMEEKLFTVLAADGTPSQRDMSNQKPFDFESVHIFKIRGGRIHDIEAMGISLPYKSKNGWSEFWR